MEKLLGWKPWETYCTPCEACLPYPIGCSMQWSFMNPADKTLRPHCIVGWRSSKQCRPGLGGVLWSDSFYPLYTSWGTMACLEGLWNSGWSASRAEVKKLERIPDSALSAHSSWETFWKRNSFASVHAYTILNLQFQVFFFFLHPKNKNVLNASHPTSPSMRWLILCTFRLLNLIFTWWCCQ